MQQTLFFLGFSMILEFSKKNKQEELIKL